MFNSDQCIFWLVCSSCSVTNDIHKYAFVLLKKVSTIQTK
jgi:hypothetical protein